MSFRNSNMSQGSEDFQGLKDATSEADYSVDGVEEKKDKKKGANKFLFKKESKDKGYASLTGYTSQESIFLVNTKESKKSKPDHKITSLNVFKKSFKEEKRLKEIKETKEEPKRSKKNKDKSGAAAAAATAATTSVKRESLFGSHLETAVASFPCNDGVRIPYPIRVCMDIIEQRGGECENLYRHVTNKSHAESICNMINKDKIEMKLDELNAEPNLACAVVKKFLKELKAPLVPDDVLGLFEKFESSSSSSTTDKESQSNKIEHLRRVVAKLPQPNLDTVSYLIMHFHRVINNVKNEKNRVEINIFVQKFLPVFRLKERLFKFWISNADLVFKDYRFKKYKLKSADETISRFSFLPDSIEDLEQEIAKQEIYLSKLHTKIANEQTSVDNTVLDQLNEELWGLQRYITSLKRKVKKLKQERKAAESEQIKNLAEAMSENNATLSDNKQVNDHATVKTVELTEQNIAEMSEQEVLLVCENSILLESIAQMLDKISQERVMIQEYQQRIMSTSGGGGGGSLVLPICTNGSADMLTEEKLHEAEQLLVKENRLLEERINLIKKRINAEKEKIAELKLNIKLKSLNVNGGGGVGSSDHDHSSSGPQPSVSTSNNNNNISQIVIELGSIKQVKDLVTSTKL